MPKKIKDVVMSHLLMAPPVTTPPNRVDNLVSEIKQSNHSNKYMQVLKYIKGLCRNQTNGLDLSLSNSSFLQTPDICNAIGSTHPHPLNVTRVFVNQRTTDIEDTTGSAFLACLLVVILLAALLGNGVVLGTLAYNRQYWCSVDVSMLSLAVSDVLVSTTCVPLFVDQVTSRDWNFGSLSCRTVPFFMHLAVSANMLTLCCLAVHRYTAVVYPLKYNTFKSMKTTQLLIVLAWIISLASSTPSVFRYDVQMLCGKWNADGTCHRDFLFSMCMDTSHDYHLISKQAASWASFIMLFVCPALVIGLAYGIIIYTLWVKATVGMVALSIAGIRNRHKRKAVKMLVCVVVLFIGSWTPLKVWFVVSVEQGVYFTATTKTLDMYLKCLAISSTAYNPIIYAFMNQKFRSNFKNILQFRKKCVRVGPLPLDKAIPGRDNHKHHHVHNKDNNNQHHCRHHHQQRHQEKSQDTEDGKESPVSNTNTTTGLQGSAPKTTTTKMTTGMTSSRPNDIWTSRPDVQQ